MKPSLATSCMFAILSLWVPSMLAAGPAAESHGRAAVENPASALALNAELAAHSRDWHQLEQKLGARRSEALRLARFEAHRHDVLEGRAITDDPFVAERTADALRSSAGKMLRRRLEDTALFDTVFDRLEARREASRAAWNEDDGDRLWRLRASPRFGLGRSSYLGVKLRIRNHERPAWSRFSLSARQYLGEDDLKLRLGWAAGDRAVFVEHLHEATGDHTTAFTVRLKL